MNRIITVDGAADVTIPDGWEPADDEEGGVLIASEEGPGLLSITAFDQPEPVDPADELFVFLEGQGVELEEDEVEDVEIGSDAMLAYCEYLTEEEDGDDADEPSTYWLVGVAVTPGRLVFASYSCPAGDQDVEREAVIEMLRTMRLRSI